MHKTIEKQEQPRARNHYAAKSLNIQQRMTH
jgi:hypothetical protein